MSTVAGVTVSLVVLGAAGVVPTVRLVGWRWTTVPLSVLGGTVVSAVAATVFLAVGGSFAFWYVAVAVASAAVGLATLGTRRPSGPGPSGRGPSVPEPSGTAPIGPDPVGAAPAGSRSNGDRWVRVVGAVALVATTVWCLRGVRTPMVGLDARLFWFLRAGWWLMPHHEALANMRTIGGATHAGYPPLVSSTVAVSWWVAGEQSSRIAQVLVAVVNGCAAAVAAWAVVDLASSVTGRIRALGATGPNSAAGPEGDAGSQVGVAPPRDAVSRWVVGRLPLLCGVGASVLLVLTFFGVTEPFTNNGYADPLWSVSAAGAIVYLLVAPPGRAGRGTALILLAVAAETKVEGAATVVGIVAVLAARTVVRARRDREPLGRLARPAALAGAAVAAIAVWPALMRLLAVGADVNTSGPRQAALYPRARSAVDAMAPHLHVLLLAAALSLAAAVVLAGVRRALSVDSDLWAWLAVAAGLGTVLTAYTVGPGNLYYLDLWLQTSSHRVSEFPALAAWWLIGTVVVVGAAAPAVLRRATAPAGRWAEAPPVPPRRETPV